MTLAQCKGLLLIAAARDVAVRMATNEMASLSLTAIHKRPGPRVTLGSPGGSPRSPGAIIYRHAVAGQTLAKLDG